MQTSEKGDSKLLEVPQLTSDPAGDAEIAAACEYQPGAHYPVYRRRRRTKIERPSGKKKISSAANSRHSTGPRTEAGKARSSRNNTRHGLFSRDLLVTAGPCPDDPAEYAAFRDSLISTVDPADPVQQALIERVSVCLWRFRRAHRFESAALTSEADNEDIVDVRERYAARLAEIDTRLKNRQSRLTLFRRDQSNLASPSVHMTPMGCIRVGEAMKFASTQLDPPEDDLKHPDVWAKAKEIAADKVREAEAAAAQVEAERAGVVAEMEVQLAAHRRLASAIPGERMLQRLIRYESMLDRQLYRALRELRYRRESDEPTERRGDEGEVVGQVQRTGPTAFEVPRASETTSARPANGPAKSDEMPLGGTVCATQSPGRGISDVGQVERHCPGAFDVPQASATTSGRPANGPAKRPETPLSGTVCATQSPGRDVVGQVKREWVKPRDLPDESTTISARPADGSCENPFSQAIVPPDCGKGFPQAAVRNGNLAPARLSPGGRTTVTRHLNAWKEPPQYHPAQQADEKSVEPQPITRRRPGLRSAGASSPG